MMQMAGLAPTPVDRTIARLNRRIAKLNRLAEQELLLKDAIIRREQGAEGTRPMPFVGLVGHMRKEEPTDPNG